MSIPSQSNLLTPNNMNSQSNTGQGAPSYARIKTLTSTQTAHLLGISTTSAQKLLDLNVLKGWRTGKGHRRFTQDSVHAYINETQNISINGSSHASNTVKVLVIKENDNNRKIIEEELTHSHLKIQLKWFECISVSLIELVHGKYHVLIIDKSLTQSENENLMMALAAYCKNHLTHPLSILFYSTNPKNEINTSIDWGFAAVHFMTSPFDPHWLQAYLTGMHDKVTFLLNSKIS